MGLAFLDGEQRFLVNHLLYDFAKRLFPGLVGPKGSVSHRGSVIHRSCSRFDVPAGTRSGEPNGFTIRVSLEYQGFAPDELDGAGLGLFVLFFYVLQV
jgi:hypothetical protein